MHVVLIGQLGRLLGPDGLRLVDYRAFELYFDGQELAILGQDGTQASFLQEFVGVGGYVPLHPCRARLSRAHRSALRA